MTKANELRRTLGSRSGCAVIPAVLLLLTLTGCPGVLPDNSGNSGAEVTPTSGLKVNMEVSSPANGSYFTPGERIVITIGLEDDGGAPVSIDTLSQARLMIAGPKGANETVTAVGLLNTSNDREAGVHHYAQLNAEGGNPNLSVSGGKLTFTTEPVGSEMPGTYIVGLWSTRADEPLAQAFPTREFQIGTDEIQPEIVGNCGDCHLGTVTGKYYLHHIDPGHSPTGDYSIDSNPVTTCKTCHNEDGYAAYCNDRNESPCSSANRVSDPIVRRVHGVHMGEQLRSPFDNNPDNGDFKDYIDVVFPADVRDCTKCHLDDSWKTKPSRLACGACHDYVDFASGTLDPPRVLGTPSGGNCVQDSDCDADYGGDTLCNTDSGECELAVHRGGAQANDAACAACHTSTAGVGLAPIPDSHEIPAPPFQYDVDLTMSAPTNGTYYVDEAPVLTVKVQDAVTGAVVDPNTITEPAYGRANIYVSGPREHTDPVLTTAAGGIEAIRAEVASANQPWDFSSATDFQLKIDGGTTITINVSAGTWADLGSVTTDEVLTWLRANTDFAAVATAVADVSSRTGTDRLKIKSNSRGSASSVEILESDVSTAMGLAVGTYGPVETHSYANNDFRVRTDPFDGDPRITRSTEALSYQLDSVAGLNPGTYTVFVEVGSTYPVSWGLLNFQIGTDAEEPMVASSCTDCHEDTRQHASFFAVKFNPDICKSCHDYERQVPDRMAGDPPDGWGANAAPGRSNEGFGAAPLSRRIHGVHYGHYLDKPEEVNGSYDFSGVIFPQDVRNCTKCHSTESTAWADDPSRLACLACHDEDDGIAHGTLMTLDPTPEDAWSGDEQESCEVCHGSDADFAVEEVHKISDPYVPPYPREPTGD